MCKVGELVRAVEGTLAHFNGDVNGVIEKTDGHIIYVRMDKSLRLVPFTKGMLEIRRKPASARHTERK